MPTEKKGRNQKNTIPRVNGMEISHNISDREVNEKGSETKGKEMLVIGRR